MNESGRQYYAMLQILRTLIRDKCACQTTKTSKWCWCDEKWNIQRDRMKCVYEVTYTLKMNRETINNLCIGQVTKTRKWIYCVCKSEIISISKSIFVKGTWNLAYLTRNIVILRLKYQPFLSSSWIESDGDFLKKNHYTTKPIISIGDLIEQIQIKKNTT